MRFLTWALLSFVSSTVVAAPTPAAQSLNKRTNFFSPVTLFTSPSSYTTPGALYSRTVQLPNGDLLATWENYSPEPPHVYFPIYRSTNGGQSWSYLSSVQDTVNGWGLRYQPQLYVLPAAIGGYGAGTVLLAGNSIPTDLSKTQIDLYASNDSGKSWKFVSHIVNGGKAVPNNGQTPVWEPFLMLYNGQLVCYYSDQRDPAHGQKLAHMTSNDLKSWSAPVNDVAYPAYSDRPGMTTVVQMANGKWIMTYEYGGGGGFNVFYRIASSPLNFNSAAGTRLKATNGATLTSSPYIVWSSQGGSAGTLVVSGGNKATVFISRDNAATWTEVNTPAGKSYSRSLRILAGQPDHLLISEAGSIPGPRNSVKVSVMNLNTV